MFDEISSIIIEVSAELWFTNEWLRERLYGFDILNELNDLTTSFSLETIDKDGGWDVWTGGITAIGFVSECKFVVVVVVVVKGCRRTGAPKFWSVIFWAASLELFEV